MFSVGQQFHALNEFFKRLEEHEIEANGTFEVTKYPMSNGRKTKIVCRCSGAMEAGQNRPCSAYIVVESYDSTATVVVESKLIHSHTPVHRKAIIDKRTTAERPSENELRKMGFGRKIIPLVEKSRFALPQVPRHFSATDRAVINSGELCLEKLIWRAKDGRYHCAFCANFASFSRQIVVGHLDKIHKKRSVLIGNHFYVACFSACQADRRRPKAAVVMHYHCRCGIVFVSEKAIRCHVNSGACAGMDEDTFEEMDPRPNHRDDIPGPSYQRMQQSRPIARVGALRRRQDHGPRKPAATMIRRPTSVVTFEDVAMEEFECEYDRSDSSFEEEGEEEDDMVLDVRTRAPAKCHMCNEEYDEYEDLRDHIVSYHPEIRPAVNLLCTICGSRVSMTENLAKHYRDDHGILDCKVESAMFQSARDFYRWKSDLETKTCTYFAKRRRTTTDSEVTLFYTCFASWGDNRKTLKEKRMERHCAAFMKAVQQRGSVSVAVTYCRYHVGHDTPADQFWKSVKRSLHCQLTFRRMKDDQEGSAIARFQRDQVDLDNEVATYWDLMRSKLESSGVYALSISKRWTENEEDRLCNICQVEYQTRSSLMRHMIRTHGTKGGGATADGGGVSQSKFRKPVRCLFCNMQLPPPGIKNLISHYINAHGQDLTLEISVFGSVNEFNAWRDAAAGSMLRRYKSYQACNGESRQYWACKYSGKLKNPPAGVTEGHCPAWVMAREAKNGTVTVAHCLRHIGHDHVVQAPPTSFAPMVLRTNGAIGIFQPLILQQLPISSVPVIVTGASVTDVKQWQQNLLAPQVEEATSYQSMEANDGEQGEAVLLTPAVLRSPEATITVIDSGIAMPSVPSTTHRFTFGGSQPAHTHTGGQAQFGSMDAEHQSGMEEAESQQEEAEFCSQIEVSIRSTSGRERLLTLSLTEFPLVLKDGKRYFALERAQLMEKVSQMLAERGEVLYEDDQITIPHNPMANDIGD